MNNELEQQRERLSHVVSQREALVDRIGTGQVKIGSSWENTLRVGRIRAKVKTSATKLRGELTQVDQEINITGQARNYLGQLTLRQTQLGEMSEMVAEGHLPEDALRQYQQEYTSLVSQQDTNPALKRAVERLKAEEEARKGQSGTEKPAPPRVDVATVVLPTRVETPPATVVTPDEGRRGSERFKLPSGEEVGGKMGKLLSLIAEGSVEDLRMSDQLAREVYPGVEEKVALQRLSVLKSQVRHKLQGTGLELVGVSDPGRRRSGEKGGYYLSSRSEQPEQSPAVQPSIPTTEGFRFEDGAIVSGELGKMLDALAPFGTQHVVTYQDLLREIGDAGDPQALNNRLGEVRSLLHPRRHRLAYVPNPRDPRNIGYYVEAIRTPKVRMTVFGDVVRSGDKQDRLSEDQYRLLWALAYHREDPVFANELSERAFNEPNPDVVKLAEVATALDQKLSEITGEEAIVVPGGDEKFGVFYKIKDARITRKPGHFPVHPTRLEALSRIFQNPDISRDEIIRILGVTRGRKYESRPLTNPQAIEAISRAVFRLNNRATENITTETESNVYLEMADYIARNNLTDNKALIGHIAERLGVSHNPGIVEDTIIEPDIAPISGASATTEAFYIDEQVRSIEVAEYGPLSRADVSIMAATLRVHKSRLNPFLEKRGIKPIEETVLGDLVDLVGDEPIARLSSMSESEMNNYLNDYRVKAFGKVKEILTSSDLQTVCDGIFEKNPNVWAFLVNLSELSQVIQESGQNREGISFIEELLTAPLNVSFVTDPHTGIITAVKFKESVGTEPKKTTPLTVEATAPAEINNNGVHTEEPIVAPEVDSNMEVSAEVTETVEITETIHVDIAPAAPATTIEPYVQKPKSVEQRDPNIRTTISEYLSEILAQPELSRAISPAYFTRHFPRIKSKLQDEAVEAGIVPTLAGRSNRGQFMFDPVGMATLLYLNDHGRNLPSRLKSQIQDIVTEEYRKRQEKK